MAHQPAINVSGCDPNTPLLAKAMSRSSISHRPSFVKLPMRSTASRISLVGDNASLEPKLDVMYGTTNGAMEFSWFDNLLGVFCITRRTKFESVQTTVSVRPPHYRAREDHVDSRSPWVLPVYVLSTERDEHRHSIPKEAKCTIDTGNLQGNLVSRAFLVDVLGYSEADFHELTREEEHGGTGITGHRLIPEGAISLTWYHSNSSRVFRDMRFLISEHPIYDLIIGAHSIRENNILDVPNLMTHRDGIVFSTENDALREGLTADEFKVLEELRKEVIKANEAFITSKEEREEIDVIKNKFGECDAKKSEYHKALRRAYRKLIWAAEKKGTKGATEHQRLLVEYSGCFSGESLDTLLRMDEDEDEDEDQGENEGKKDR